LALKAPPVAGVQSTPMTNLETGYALDRRWHWLRGETMQDGADASKQLALEALAAVLGASGVPYAIIGGVALQVHVLEPRTTLDIDVAVADLQLLPIAAMQQAGFSKTGAPEHSENWQGPGRFRCNLSMILRLRPRWRARFKSLAVLRSCACFVWKICYWRNCALGAIPRDGGPSASKTWPTCRH